TGGSKLGGGGGERRVPDPAVGLPNGTMLGGQLPAVACPKISGIGADESIETVIVGEALLALHTGAGPELELPGQGVKDALPRFVSGCVALVAARHLRREQNR